jgi:quercetin dioxygenase-like cupin family protein
MARRVVDSQATGEIFTFDDAWLDEHGRVKQVEYELRAGHAVPPHFHPGIVQNFRVISGMLNISCEADTRVLKAGEEFATPPGAMHAQWNDGPEMARVLEGYEPPLDIEPFFTALGAAVASRNLLKMAVFFSDFRAISWTASLGPRLTMRDACSPWANPWLSEMVRSSPSTEVPVAPRLIALIPNGSGTRDQEVTPCTGSRGVRAAHRASNAASDLCQAGKPTATD